MKSQLTTFVSEHRDPTGTLVVVFLRGGADGLNMVVPHGDDRYYGARPGIGKRFQSRFVQRLALDDQRKGRGHQC